MSWQLVLLKNSYLKFERFSQNWMFINYLKFLDPETTLRPPVTEVAIATAMISDRPRLVVADTAIENIGQRIRQINPMENSRLKILESMYQVFRILIPHHLLFPLNFCTDTIWFCIEIGIHRLSVSSSVSTWGNLRIRSAVGRCE